MEIIELDIWYAIDKHGRVIELLTSGFGNIPKFIYESKCNKVLEDYFEKIIDIYQFDASAGEENTTKYLRACSESPRARLFGKFCRSLR